MSKKVYVTGWDPALDRMFSRAGWTVTSSDKMADAVVFIGGADIDPAFYGERKGPKMKYTSMADDCRDKAAWMKTDNGKNSQLKIGVCRGAQFVNVMNNGKLIQHVNNHSTGEHEAIDAFVNPGSKILITSVHHQMMIPTDDAEILAYSEGVGGEYWGQNGIIEAPKIEPEAVWYDRTQSLCVQFHPEYNDMKNNTQAHVCREYFFQLLDKVM